MRANKLTQIVLLAVLYFQIRESRQRSLKDDETVSNKIGDIEELNVQECICLPKNRSGTPATEYFNSEGQERLVVYTYKDPKSKKTSVFIPGLREQRVLSEINIESGDKMETNAPDELFNLFHDDYQYNTKNTEGIDINTIFPNDGDDAVHDISNNQPNQDKLNNLVADNQVSNSTIVFPEDSNQFPLADNMNTGQSLVSSHDFFDKKPLDNNTNQDFLPFLGNTPQKNQSVVFEVSREPKQRLETQNQPTQITLPDNNKAIFLPTKSYNEGSMIPTASPGDQRRNLLLGDQNRIVNAPRDLNMPIYQSPNSKESSFKYMIPGYVGNVPPSDLLSAEYLPSKYKHPIFDEWFKDQIKSIRLKRPSTFNAINFQSLRLFLMKALYENGIHFSSKGELYDSNGNILKISNLKVRPILLGDPIDYQKLVATSKCVIPYDISYLEAVLVTLAYPPRILAIIPLGKLFVSKTKDNIVPFSYRKKSCGQSNCKANGDLRLSLPEEAESNSVLNAETNNLGRSGKTTEENEQIITKDGTPKYDDFINNEEEKLTEMPESKLDSQIDLIQTPVGLIEKKILYLDKGNYIEARIPSEDFDVPPEIVKQPDEVDDTLGFRIVGGNPATSSGTPVSSKGRSGVEKEEV